MELQRILAADIRLATAEVARRFGPDALIVSSRNLMRGHTEVIVAIETEVVQRHDDDHERTGSPGAFTQVLGKALNDGQRSWPVTEAKEPDLEMEQRRREEQLRAGATAGKEEHRDREGEVLVDQIRTELAQLRAELQAMRQRRDGRHRLIPGRQLARSELASGGLATAPLERLLGHVGESADIPVLSAALADMLDVVSPGPWQGRAHTFWGPSWPDCTTAMLALARAQEATSGPGSACVISLADHDERQWSRLQKACVQQAIGCLRIGDPAQLPRLLDALLSDTAVVFLANDCREDPTNFADTAAAIQQISRHLVLAPGQSAQIDAAIKGHEKAFDSILITGLEKPGSLLPVVSLALSQGLPISATTRLTQGQVQAGRDLADIAEAALAHLVSDHAGAVRPVITDDSVMMPKQTRQEDRLVAVPS